MSNKMLSKLVISGPEAFKLLQGQLSCDLENLNPAGCYGAHCNPQGRIINFFYIKELTNGYELIMPNEMIDIALSALKKYSVFYKVDIFDQVLDPLESANMDLFNIHKKIPRIHQETSGMFLPHELGLEKINAISFDKGCYTGQEVIARIHYRGKLKKGIHLAKVKSTSNIKPGDDIFFADNQKEAGHIVDAVNDNTREYTILVICNHKDVRPNHLIIRPDNTLIEFQE